MAGELNGEIAIVTGGGRGFGKAIALHLAAAGARVTVTSRSPEQLKQTVSEITDGGGEACAVPGDVTCREDVARVVCETEQQFGPVTLLVNNAGVAHPFGPVWEVDPDEWWHTQAVHVRGTLLYMHALLSGMVARRRGRVINIASLGGHRVSACLSAYGVAKNTQIRLTEHAALEAKEHGVAVFAIEPGTVITEMAEQTMASPDAQRWVPDMLEILKELKRTEDPAAGFARCGEMCVALASGRYDALSGRYLEPQDDFDALLASEQV